MKKLILLLAIFCFIGTLAAAQIVQDSVQTDPMASLPLKGGTLEGNLLFSPDDTYDIGASGDNRPHHIFAGGDFIAGDDLIIDSLGEMRWGSNTIMSRESDQVIQLGRDGSVPDDYELKAGDGAGTDTNGADLTISGGDGSLINSDGGDVILNVGTGQGTGTNGAIIMGGNIKPSIHDTFNFGTPTNHINNMYADAYLGSDDDSYMNVRANTVEFYANGNRVVEIQSSVGLTIHDHPLIWETDGGGDIGTSTGNRPRNIYTWNEIHAGGSFVSAEQTETISDSGDANPASFTLNPWANYVEFICNDAQGCNVTMGENNNQHRLVVITNNSANPINFSDTAGVSELAGAFEMGNYDTLTLQYTGSRWIEVSRSNN